MTRKQAKYVDLAPGQIVPRLADHGIHLACESTLYRILRSEGLQHHRGRAKAPTTSEPPTTYSAGCPNKIWCWHVIWIPGPMRGQFCLLYLILDLSSRKIVGFGGL